MHRPKELQAVVPAEGAAFYRLLTNPRIGARDYFPNAALGKDRLWPGRGEDWLTYLGISCWDLEQRALDLARNFNPLWQARKGYPRWTHMARFHVDGHLGFAYAWQGPTEGHFTVWGEAEILHSSQEEPIPILP